MSRPRRHDRLTALPDEVCAENVVHLHEVQMARTQLPSLSLIGGMTDLFAALGDPTRLRIIAALSAQELCVCDLAATIGLTESAVSHQLRLLRRLGLVRSRRDGRLVYYMLDDEHVEFLYEQALDHVSHSLADKHPDQETHS